MEQQSKTKVDDMLALEESAHLNTGLSLYDLSDNIKIDFDEIYKDEEENIKNTAIGKAVGGGAIHDYYKPVFYWTEAIIYYSLAIPIGAIMTVCWGLIFGLNRLVMIWLVRPAMKFCLIWLSVIGVLNRAVIRVTLDPVIESFSLIGGNLRGRFQFSANQPLDSARAAESGLKKL